MLIKLFSSLSASLPPSSHTFFTSCWLKPKSEPPIMAEYICNSCSEWIDSWIKEPDWCGTEGVKQVMVTVQAKGKNCTVVSSARCEHTWSNSEGYLSHAKCERMHLWSEPWDFPKFISLTDAVFVLDVYIYTCDIKVCLQLVNWSKRLWSPHIQQNAAPEEVQRIDVNRTSKIEVPNPATPWDPVDQCHKQKLLTLCEYGESGPEVSS